MPHRRDLDFEAHTLDYRVLIYLTEAERAHTAALRPDHSWEHPGDSARHGFLTCPGMANAATDPRAGRAHARQRHRPRLKTDFRASLQTDRPDDRHREPVGCIADLGRRRGRQGRP